MKNKVIYNFETIFLVTFLFFFTMVQSISIKSNHNFITLTDNYFNNEKVSHNEFPSFIQIEKTENLNSTNYVKKIIENAENRANVLNPFLEKNLENLNLISSKFLGTVIPKLEEEDKVYNIDCSHINLSSENYDSFKKKCNNTYLLEFEMRQKEKITFETNQKKLKCDNDTCRPEHGKCISDIECICNNGFVTNPDSKINLFCSYKQKKQLIFFLTEFFAPLGLGHILNGRFLYGIIKCSIIVGLIMLDLISKCVLLCGKEKGTKWPNYFSFFYLLIIIFWQAYDITMIGFNKFKEDNGMTYIQVEV